MNPSKRNDTIDLIKTFAILSVVAIHVSAPYVAGDVTSAYWPVACFFRSFASGGVPLFFMASGALLLRPEKEMPLKKLYGKNMLRILAALFVWAFVYRLAPIYGGIHSLGELKAALADLLFFRHKDHLYYLHVMILVYAFLPMSRIVACHAAKSDRVYLLVLWFILGIFLPTLKAFYPLDGVGAIPLQWIMVLSYSAMGYTFMGYVLSDQKPAKTPFAFSAAMGFLLIFGGTFILSRAAGLLEERLFEGTSVGVCLWAMGLFALAQHIPLSEKMKARVLAVSNASFAIYLVHVLVLDYLKNFFPVLGRLNPLVGIPTVTIAVFAVSYMIYKCLSIIPLVRKWLI